MHATTDAFKTTQIERMDVTKYTQAIVSLNMQKCKSITKCQSGKTIWFKKKWNWKFMSLKPKIGRDLNSAVMHFGANLEILTRIGGKWLRVQAQNGVNSDI